MRRLVTLMILSALLVVSSFRTDVPGQQAQFNAKNATEAVAIMAEHTARLGFDLVEKLTDSGRYSMFYSKGEKSDEK